EANMQAISTLQSGRYISLWLDLEFQSAENEYMRMYWSRRSGSDVVNWTVKRGWVGAFQMIGGTKIDKGPFNESVYMRELHAPNPRYSYFESSSIGSVLCTISVKPGKAKTAHLPISNQTIGRSWQTLKSWTVPQATEVTASAKLTFANKSRIADYGLRILLD